MSLSNCQCRVLNFFHDNLDKKRHTQKHNYDSPDEDFPIHDERQSANDEVIRVMAACGHVTVPNALPIRFLRLISPFPQGHCLIGMSLRENQ